MSKDEQLYSDVGDIKECLIGNPLKSINGLVNDVHALDAKMCTIENRIHSLEQKKKDRKSIKLPLWIVKLFGL